MTAVVFGQSANTTTTTTRVEREFGDIVITPPSTTVANYIDDSGLTINYVQPGWTVVDDDNTSPEEAALQQDTGTATLATLCPPYSRAETSGGLTIENCAQPNHGQVFIRYFPALDKQESFVQRATVVNPDTGLFELNLTAQTLVEWTMSPLTDMIVQKKTVPVNVTFAGNGTTSQVPGLLVLFTSPTELDLGRVGLYFIDHTTGYEIKVNGPVGAPEPLFPDSPPIPPDPRGDPIPIHGIGLDNLPAVMAEPMQIVNSVSITRR